MLLRVPLDAPPVVVQVGVNQHGRVRREPYHLAGLWGLHLYHYQGAVTVSGRRFAFTPGGLSLTPPDADLEWEFPAKAPHHYALLRFADHSTFAEVAVLRQLDPTRAQAYALAWEDAIAACRDQPLRAAAWAWDLMWRLAQTSASRPALRLSASGVPEVADGSTHPAVQIAMRLIADDPARRHTLAGLARRTGVSANHLIRLFRGACGRTPMEQVRHLRAAAALALLTGSSLPIAAIATRVGVADAQAFNKLMRHCCGAAPSVLRQRGGGDV